MFQFSYKLKVAERVKAKCAAEFRVDAPLASLSSTSIRRWLSLDAAHREFLRRALPWVRVRRSHTNPHHENLTTQSRHLALYVAN
jgi:hypothetical protein